MFSIQETVTTSRTDHLGNLKLFSAFQMLQDCSELWLDAAPEYQEFLKQNGMAQLLAFRQVEIIRVPRFKEKLTITTSVFDCKELFGFRNTFIYDESHNPCYKTWSLGVFVELSSGKMKKLPREVMQATKMDAKQEMSYRDRRILVPTDFTELPQSAPLAVTKNDIDYNQHMNNAHYIRMACEFLPENFQVQHVRIDYKKPAKLGDILIPEVYSGNASGKDCVYVKLSCAGSVCALVEFES